MNEHTKPLDHTGFRQHTIGDHTVQIFTVGTGHTHVAVRVAGLATEYSKSHQYEDAALRDYASQVERLERAVPRAEVTLFKPSGKYYTSEEWRIPSEVQDHSAQRGDFTRKVIGPFDMRHSPDFRRIDGGPVLVESQSPWGYPHLFPGDE